MSNMQTMGKIIHFCRGHGNWAINDPLNGMHLTFDLKRIRGMDFISHSLPLPYPSNGYLWTRNSVRAESPQIIIIETKRIDCLPVVENGK